MPKFPSGNLAKLAILLLTMASHNTLIPAKREEDDYENQF